MICRTQNRLAAAQLNLRIKCRFLCAQTRDNKNCNIFFDISIFNAETYVPMQNLLFQRRTQRRILKFQRRSPGSNAEARFNTEFNAQFNTELNAELNTCSNTKAKAEPSRIVLEFRHVSCYPSLLPHANFTAFSDHVLFCIQHMH